MQTAYTQSNITPEMRQKMLRDILAEKMHQVNEIEEEHDISGMLRTTATGNDKKVSLSTAGSTEEAETAIVVDPNDDNNLVLSFMSQSTSTALSFPIYYSSNKGATWFKCTTFNTQTIAAADFPGGIIAGGGDPVFAWDKNGTLYFAWIYLVLNSAHDTSYFTLNWAYSNDKGHTWQIQPGENHFIGQGAVNPGTGAEYNYKDGVCDREWFAIDNSGGPRQGTLYCAFINFTFGGGGESIKTKAPSATSFGPMKLTYKGSSQLVNLECSHGGRLHMTFADLSDNTLNHIYSFDGSNPFLSHKIYQGTALFGKKNIVTDRENAAPSLAIDGNDNLHVVWSDFVGSGSAAGKVYSYYSMSSDSGFHWTTPKRLDSLSPVFSGKQMFMPTVSAGKNNVTITVTAIDPHSLGDSARVYQITSSNYGQSFIAWPLLLSSQPTYYKQYTPLSNYFFGDYNKSVSSDCMTYAIWEDGRTTQGIKVYTASTNQCVTGVQQVSSVTSSLQLQSVYPNPASDHVTLQYSDVREEAITVSILDMTGKLILQKEYHTKNGTQEINMPIALNSGSYILSVNNAEGLVATRNLQVVK